MGNYQKAQEKIAELEQQIAQRKKFIESETDAEIVEKINEEIKRLEEAKKIAQKYANAELNGHLFSTEILNDFNPDKDKGQA